MTAIAAINMDLSIPAGAADFAATAEHRFDQDTILYSLLPHMHLRGKSFRFEAVFPDGRREVLLDVPRYEFEWQNVYVLSEPKLMPEGSVLRCLARYDNSAGNLSNPDPKATVTWGEQTRDEMLVGYVEVALGRPGPEPGRARRPGSSTTAATRSRSATAPRPAPRRSTWPAPSTTGSRPR